MGNLSEGLVVSCPTAPRVHSQHVNFISLVYFFFSLLSFYFLLLLSPPRASLSLFIFPTLHWSLFHPRWQLRPQALARTRSLSMISSLSPPLGKMTQLPMLPIRSPSKVSSPSRTTLVRVTRIQPLTSFVAATRCVASQLLFPGSSTPLHLLNCASVSPTTEPRFSVRHPQPHTTQVKDDSNIALQTLTSSTMHFPFLPRMALPDRTTQLGPVALAPRAYLVLWVRVSKLPAPLTPSTPSGATAFP